MLLAYEYACGLQAKFSSITNSYLDITFKFFSEVNYVTMNL